MRIVHTADWHLGKRMDQLERTAEHQHFLNWLLEQLKHVKPDVLIVAGDIFDTGNPPNSALRLYYEFLSRVRDCACGQVVIIGGNHDSIAALEAPQELLRFFNVHVIGGIPDDPAEQIIEIKDSSGNLKGVVVAVPFIRDRDVRLSVAGESPEEQERRLKEGIIDHYQRLVPMLEIYRQRSIPIVGTGHLFAQGGTKSDDERDIHVGNLGQIAGDSFPEIFDYIALGHLHRPQIVGGLQHIRYSGSPIPLDFSERTDTKQILQIDISTNKQLEIQSIEVPGNRKLIGISGSLEDVITKIKKIEHEGDFNPWLDIRVEVEEYQPDLEDRVKEAIQRNSIIEFYRLRMTRVRSHSEIVAEEPVPSLSELSPEDVFEIKCTEEQINSSDKSEMLATFREAMELMQQQDFA